MRKAVIGLEIHVELKTKTKMFCDSLNDPDEKHSNINICPICLGHPGTLPVINKEAVNKVIMTGLALNCHIAEDTFFERKHYFYPDLPKGYQISQYQKPLCENGHLDIENKKIRITRIHLEEDAGRLYHPAGADYSLVDYNRAGVPLMELVTEPDFENGAEVRQFAEELQLIMRYLCVSDADMEKGQMRIEVNISLTKPNGEWGTKVEIKNLNSIKAAANSVDYEVTRQTELLEKGEEIKQETRGWDDTKGLLSAKDQKKKPRITGISPSQIYRRSIMIVMRWKLLNLEFRSCRISEGGGFPTSILCPCPMSKFLLPTKNLGIISKMWPRRF